MGYKHRPEVVAKLYVQYFISTIGNFRTCFYTLRGLEALIEEVKKGAIKLANSLKMPANEIEEVGRISNSLINKWAEELKKNAAPPASSLN